MYELTEKDKEYLLYYKNNRAVTEPNLKQLANSFAKNLRNARFEVNRLM